MRARTEILNNVKNSQPLFVPLHLPLLQTAAPTDLVAQFEAVLKSVGGSMEVADDYSPVYSHMQQLTLQGKSFINQLAVGKKANGAAAAFYEAADTAFVHGRIAVAENGAVWVTESDMGHRIVPFICSHLVLVVPRSCLVPTLHEAYAAAMALEGYGVFISGPSKTADIEQSLVIGAHAATSLKLYLIND